MTTFQLREIKEQDLPLILKWRNSERIKHSMYSNEIITWEQHVSWRKKGTNHVSSTTNTSGFENIKKAGDDTSIRFAPASIFLGNDCFLRRTPLKRPPQRSKLVKSGLFSF